MHKSRQSLLVAVFAVAACGQDVTGSSAVKDVTRSSAVIVDNVVITATVPGNCSGAMPCDSAGAPFTTLGLITVRNSGVAIAYVNACGPSVALTEQQLVDSLWKSVGPEILCAQGPVSIALAAGDSIQRNWWFAPGTRRLVLGVASAADLSGEAPDVSASFVVH